MAGNLIIVSAPSGAGKTTLVELMLKRLPDVQPSISLTARAPRPGEEHGRHYHFVTPAEFQSMIDRGEFLEWAEVHGNLYGTPRRAVEECRRDGQDVVLTIDVQGASAARALFADAVSVFILPPSRQSLEERLHARGTDSAEVRRRRLENARAEIAEYSNFDYLIVNDNLERATDDLVAIVLAARCARDRRGSIAEAILQQF